MDTLTIVAVGIFVLGYLGITLEHKISTSKSAIALIMGGLLWLLIALTSSPEAFHEEILHSGAEIFEIVIFLLAAMSLVEVLVHYQLFDVIRGKVFALGLDEKKQFIVITALAFVLSGVIDNLTATIVMVQIARRFFKDRNLLIAIVGIVISANAGGAFSPIGDVTTIMLWLAGKFETLEIILRGFLPSLTLYIISTFLLYQKVTPSNFDIENEIITELTRSEKIIVALVFASFSLPIFMGILQLPPYIGLIIGLGVVWIVVDMLRKYTDR
ncbi:sodium:proton antiporter NhaD, partial [candidate division WWE3 bacterium]|nr:sodium:proton antiporter NhaD [candidate division WWE3 bacterium]